MYKRLIVIGLVACTFFWLTTANSIAKQNELRIGVVAPLTGPAARTGVEFKYSIKMAFDEVGNKIGDYNVKIIWIDSESDPEKATRAYEQAVLREKMDVGLCNWHSSVAVALMSSAAKNRVPHYFGIGSTGVVNEKFNSNRDRFGYWMAKGWPEPWKTSVAYSIAFEEAIKKGIWKPRNKKAVIYGEDTDWGRSVCAGIRDQLKGYGWEILAEDYIKLNETDFYPLLTKYKKMDVSLVAGSISTPPSAASFIKQFREIGVNSLLISDALGDIGEWYQMTGSAADGVLDNRAIWNTEKGKAFAKKYEELYNIYPSAASGGLVYDYARFFIKVANACLKEYGKLDRKTLYQFGRENLWTGKISFTDGVVMDEYAYAPETLPDPIVGAGKFIFPINQYFGGKSTIVWPANWKTGELSIPSYAQ